MSRHRRPDSTRIFRQCREINRLKELEAMTDARPQFIPKYVETDLYDILRAEVPWVNRDSPRGECFMSSPGSLFIMPGGYQQTHQHRIPKHDRECGGRISLTFRKLDR